MNIVVDTNNQGVSLLQQGRTDQALRLLKQSAELLFKITRVMNHTLIVNHEEPWRETSTRCFPSETNVHVDDVIVQSTPIIMKYVSEPETCCTVESATILMNMALCYHLISTTSINAAYSAENAISLYQMSSSLCLQAIADPRAHHIMLTSLNNLGQLYHERGDFDNARFCFDDLATFVLHLREEGYHESITGLQEFMLNAIILRNPIKNAAAA